MKSCLYVSAIDYRN